MKGMNNICSINQKWVREPSPDPPGEQRELVLQYKVKYPKNRRLTIE